MEIQDPQHHLLRRQVGHRQVGAQQPGPTAPYRPQPLPPGSRGMRVSVTRHEAGPKNTY